MICPKCGNQIADGSLLCPFCNQQFVVNQPMNNVQVQQNQVSQPVQVQVPVQNMQIPSSVQIQQSVNTETLPGQVVENNMEVSNNAPVMYSAPIVQNNSVVNYSQAPYQEIKSNTANATIMQPVEDLVKQPQDRLIVTNGITDMKPQEFETVNKIEEKPIETVEDIIGKKSKINFKKIFLVLFLIIILVVGTIAVLHFSGIIKVKTNVTTGKFTQTTITSRKTLTADDSSSVSVETTTSTTEEIKYTTTTAALVGTAYTYKGLVFTIPSDYRIAEDNGVKSIDRIDGSLNIRLADVYTGTYAKAVSEIDSLKQYVVTKYSGATNVSSAASTASGLRYLAVSFDYNDKHYHIIYYELNDTYLVETVCYSDEFTMDEVASRTGAIVASSKTNGEKINSTETNSGQITLPII